MEELGAAAGPAEVNCWGCGAAISGADNYCKVCGKGQGAFIPWQYKHWGIVVTALCLGPFALYFVWRSPAVSRNAKLAYTALIAVFTWAAVKAFYSMWNLFQAMLGLPLGAL